MTGELVWLHTLTIRQHCIGVVALDPSGGHYNVWVRGKNVHWADSEDAAQRWLEDYARNTYQPHHQEAAQ